MSGTLKDRIKRYEEVSDTKLVNHQPVIVRLDGKSFHTLTKTLDKPYDEDFSQAMTSTMWHLLRTVSNCVFGYTSSDEISLVLIEPSVMADSWFDNRVSKLTSVIAAEASTFFRDYLRNTFGSRKKFLPLLSQAIFDARAFNIPKHDIINYFLFRQRDSIRNAISGVGQSLYSQKELNGLNSAQLIDKFKKEKNIDFWEDYPKEFAYGKIAYGIPVEMLNQFYTDVMIPAENFAENKEFFKPFIPDYL